MQKARAGAGLAPNFGALLAYCVFGGQLLLSMSFVSSAMKVFISLNER